ncbi:MAG: TonB-dependent receptor plug domain-containing protein [Fibrobacterota bacterium]
MTERFCGVRKQNEEMMEKNYLCAAVLVAAMNALCGDSPVMDSMEIRADRIRETDLYPADRVELSRTGDEQSLSDVLQRRAGVESFLKGGVGSPESVHIRGVDGRRIAVFIDGIPVSEVYGSTVDLSRITMDACRDVHIHKGFVPARLGAPAMGGAINISTDQHRDLTRFRAGLGSFGERFAAGRISRSTEGGTFSGHVQSRFSRNNFPYYDRNGTPYNDDDDLLQRLQNSAFTEQSAAFGFLREQTRLRLNWRRSEREIPAGEGSRNYTAHHRQEALRVQMRHASSRWAGDHRWGLSVKKNGFFWTGIDHFGLSVNTLAPDEEGAAGSREVSGTYSVGGDLPLQGPWYLSFSLHSAGQSLFPDQDIPGFVPFQWEVYRGTATLAGDLHRRREDLSLFAGGSVTGALNGSGGGTDEYTGVTLPDTLLATGAHSLQSGFSRSWGTHVTLFGSAGLSARLPALSELYGYSGGIRPNPDLDGETARKGEAGLRLKGRKKEFSVTAFAITTENMIRTLVNSTNGVARFTNIGRTRSRGIEAQGRLEGLWGDCATNITWNRAEDRSAYRGNLLPDQPEFSWRGRVESTSFKGVSCALEGEYKSRVYRDRANLKPFPQNRRGWFSLDAGITWQGGPVRADLWVLDIPDSRESIARENGYYRLLYPGRRIRSTVEITF